MSLQNSLNKVRECIRLDDIVGAEKYIAKARKVSPKDLTLQFLVGTLEYRKLNYQKAIELLEGVLKVNPDFSDAHCNLASAYSESMQFGKAEEHYRRAVELKPQDHISLNNLGSVLKKQNRYAEAQKFFQASICAYPNFWASHFNLGNIYFVRKMYPEAIDCFKEALKHKSEPVIYVSLISTMKYINPEQAYQYSLEAIRLKNPGVALLSAFGQCIQAFDWESANSIKDDVLKVAFDRTLDPTCTQGILLPINKPYGIDRQKIFELHQFWGKQAIQYCNPYTNFEKAYEPFTHIRIGYLSADFREHSVGHFIENIITNHDKRLFSVYCYSNTNQEDDLTKRIKGHCTLFAKIHNLTDEELAENIHNEGIHILVDLSGHTAHSRLTVFKYNPAPVQITYLGYPNTTGLGMVDYRITDNFAEDDEGTLYTEKLLKMPESFLCFGSFHERPEQHDLVMERKGYITFGSFNNVSKINEEVVRVWCQILHRMEGSKLLIKSGHVNEEYIQKNIYREFEKQGIGEDRIELMGFQASKDNHLDLYNEIDIALDPFPYNGTTTTCEALWMGVPVMTLVGKLHAQRVSYSILKNISVEDTIAFSEEEYIEKAVSLAGDADMLRALRERIRSSVRRSILCDPVRFTPQFEELYLQAWEEKTGRAFPNADVVNQSRRGNMSSEIDIAKQQHDDIQVQMPAQEGQWVDHLSGSAYIGSFLPLWEEYLVSYSQDEAWKIHQIAMDYFVQVSQPGEERDVSSVYLRQAYDILLKLVDINGNISNLQSLVRVAVELGEYQVAHHALVYLIKLFDANQQLEFREPFLAVSERFEQIDPEGRLGEWVYSSIIDQIQFVETLSGKVDHQVSEERFNWINKAGFLVPKTEEKWRHWSTMREAHVAQEKIQVRKLHIGGKSKQAHPEWEIINAISGPDVDHVGNAKDLSRFADNTFSEIYASHVLEHFDYHEELLAVLAEWYRVLIPGGRLYISVPDMDVLSALLLQKDKLDVQQRFHVMRMLFGGQLDEYDYHKVGLNFEFLESFLQSTGYINIRRVDEFGIFSDTSSYKPYDVLISLNVIAEKEEKITNKQRRIITAGKEIDVFDDDIFLVSSPRSGNTWLRFMLAMLLKGAKDIDFENIPHYVPDIYDANIDNNKLLAMPRPRIIKSHEMYHPGYPNVVYLIRDVRDVVVSCYYYEKKVGYAGDFDKFFNEKFMNEDIIRYYNFGTWGQNVQSWLNAKGRIFQLKYEDLLADPVKQLTELLEGLGFDVPRGKIQAAVEANDFNNMRSKEKAATEVAYLRGEGDFVRKGVVGEWRKVLKKCHIDMIKEHYGDLLIELGYESDLYW